MRGRKPFDFPHFHVIYPEMPGGSLRPETFVIAEN
jgi:hypothetical protein